MKMGCPLFHQIGFASVLIRLNGLFPRRGRRAENPYLQQADRHVGVVGTLGNGQPTADTLPCQRFAVFQDFGFGRVGVTANGPMTAILGENDPSFLSGVRLVFQSLNLFGLQNRQRIPLSKPSGMRTLLQNSAECRGMLNGQGVVGKDGKDSTRRTASLSREQAEELDRLSKREDVSVSWLLRKAVDLLIEKANDGPLLPLGGARDVHR